MIYQDWKSTIQWLGIIERNTLSPRKYTGNYISFLYYIGKALYSTPDESLIESG